MNEKDIRAAIQQVRDALGPTPGVAFAPVALAALLGLTTCRDPLGCSVSIYGAYDDDDVIFTTTHSTTTTTTTSSTTTTDTNPCDVDLTQLTGATEECSACVGHWCCGQALDFVAAPSSGTYWEVLGCAFGQNADCTYACYTQMCGDYSPYPFYDACSACIDASCCPEEGACAYDLSCSARCFSLWDRPSSCCQPDSVYKPYDECIATSCAWVCPAVLSCSAGEGGGGGAAGSGGAGGTGSPGGAGGS